MSSQNQKRKRLKLKTELRTIHLTSDGGKFFSKEEAEQHQIRCDEEMLRKELSMYEELSSLIQTILDKNNWGVHYKSHPLQVHPIDGDAPMYAVNSVDETTLNAAIKNAILEGKDDTQG